jgi:hypothetical protein
MGGWPAGGRVALAGKDPRSIRWSLTHMFLGVKWMSDPFHADRAMFL